MYSLPPFQEKDEELVKQFIKQHSFAMLIANGAPYPAATQIPLLTEERENGLFFKGHIMRQTDHHKALEKDQNVLCIFTGAHSYVSASWYKDPQVASTWNYMSVHVQGILTFLDEGNLLDILEKTTAHYEKNDQSPASYHNLSTEYIERLSKAIVGFEIEAKSIGHVFKLSQNRNQQDYKNIIQQLENEGNESAIIAGEMKKRCSQLFPKEEKQLYFASFMFTV